MGMFRSNKRRVFTPSVYETSRRRRRLPRWLILLIVGMVLGAGGLLFLQTSYGPKRLTVLESQELTDELQSVSLERQRLQSELERTARELSEAREARLAIAEQLKAAEAALQPLRDELNLFAAVMPPDPRGGPIGVSAANFRQGAGGLDYHVLLLRDEAEGQPFQGRLEMAVEGRHANGRYETLELDPLAVRLDRYQHLTGTAKLPDGFSARRVTVRVFDGEQGGRQRAMRILIVRH
jgi:hypothetical protein